MPSAAVAADWTVQPRVQLRETYTDNLRLAPSGQEESDFVTEVEPGFSIRGRGARLQVDADYALQYRLYAKNGSDNGHNHILSTHGLLDAWNRQLFIQASASIAQQNLSPLGAQSTSNINLTGNRTEVRQASLSPYWLNRFGTWGDFEARYTVARLESDSTSTSLDSDTQTVNLNLKSGPAFSTLGWNGTYTRQSVEATGGQFTDRDLETATIGLQYKIYPTLALLATGGYEDNSYGSTRESTSGPLWNVGAEWTPSSRTRIRGTVGKRFYGDTYSLDAEHRTRLTSWVVSYSEQLIATPQEFSVASTSSTASTIDRLLTSQVPNPIERLQMVNALIAQYGLPANLSSSVDFLSNQVSLSKRLQGAFGMRSVRGTFLVNVFRDDRSNENSGSTLLGTDPFLISDSVIQTGYSAVLSWRFTERTAGSVLHSQSRNRFSDAGREDTINTFRIGVTHQLQPKLVGALDWRVTERESNERTFNYRENAIIGTLTLAF